MSPWKTRSERWIEMSDAAAKNCCKYSVIAALPV